MERHYEAAFEALLRGSDDLVLLIDGAGRVLDAGSRARSELAGGGTLVGTSLLDRLSAKNGRALRAFLDALGTDGAITLEHSPDRDGVGEGRRVRYAVHAIPKACGQRDFLLIGRDEADPAPGVPTATDPLTGLADRAGMAAGLARLWASCEHAPGRPRVWMLMADIDRFKALNDSFGHPAGDAVLAGVARVLVNHVREGDLAARYGGDEFLLAGPAVNRRDAETIAGRIMEAVRGLDLAPATGPDLPPPRITISVGGLLAAPGPLCPATDAIAAADHALYRAKAAGRDRIAIEPDVLGI